MAYLASGLVAGVLRYVGPRDVLTSAGREALADAVRRLDSVVSYAKARDLLPEV